MTDLAATGPTARTGVVADPLRYLSPRWFEEVNQAACTSAELRAATAGARVTIQQVVVDGPEGDVRYWVRVDDGTVEAGRGDAHDADATVSQSYETAVAVSRGDLGVEAALQAGRIRLSGDIAVLVRHQAALGAVGGALGAVRDRTTYR